MVADGDNVLLEGIIKKMREGTQLNEHQLDLVHQIYDNELLTSYVAAMNNLVMTGDSASVTLKAIEDGIGEVGVGASQTGDDIKNLTDEIFSFSGAREELFFGGKFGNVTGSLYRQVVKQGVGTLYHKNEIIMNTNFHGFFNEQEAAAKIIAIMTAEMKK